MSLLHIISFSILLFLLGLTIVLVRRQLLFILMGLEIMINGVVLIFIGAGKYWGSANGQVISLFIMLVAGSELAITLLIAMLSYRYLKTTRIDNLNQLSDRLNKENELL